MLKDPILYAKEIADEPDAREALDRFVKIFHLEELLEDEAMPAEQKKQAKVQAELIPTPVRA